MAKCDGLVWQGARPYRTKKGQLGATGGTRVAVAKAMRASETAASTTTSAAGVGSRDPLSAAVPVGSPPEKADTRPFGPRPRAMQRARGTPTWLVFDVPDARAAALGRAVGRAIRARPLAAITLAAGLGFLVGGVLSFRAGRFVLFSGGRHVARELLKQLI